MRELDVCNLTEIDEETHSTGCDSWRSSSVYYF